ncbi:hypothetical protein HELRODRAFT_165700 [Helobdella robusta]|uniref:Uncharacterized protein n=1 Tax=Helobdella robusta TaxID=6412 RepID=T1EX67_HELRO|nr:hypothetical protein HELRODRAFT_165700 [Helobdella robusta]ESN91647.1 hypothetical protein HELRODRAFT_165700 [Helobdella robusta]
MNKISNKVSIEASQSRGWNVNKAFTYSSDVGRTCAVIKITDGKKCGSNHGGQADGDVDESVNGAINSSDNNGGFNNMEMEAKMEKDLRIGKNKNNSKCKNSIVENLNDGPHNKGHNNINNNNHNSGNLDDKDDGNVATYVGEKIKKFGGKLMVDNQPNCCLRRKLIQMDQSKVNKSLRHINLKDEDEDLYFLASDLWNFVDEVSVIGVKHCADSNRSVLNRFMWFIFIMFGFLLAVYQINDRLMHYLTYPTLTDYDIVSAHITLPQVTICNGNYVKKSSAESQEVIKSRKISSPGLEQLVKCFWNGVPCSKETLGTTFSNAGQCIVVNPRKSKLQLLNAPGATTGLVLFLYANQSDYLMKRDFSQGFNVLVHDPEEPPRMLELGFKVNVDEEVNVAVSVTKTTRLKHPYGSCTDQKGYHQIKCSMRCLTEVMIKNCSCRPIYMEEIGNESICNYDEEFLCTDKVMSNFFIGNFRTCVCPPMCNEMTFQTSVTRSELSNTNLHVIRKFFDEKFIKFTKTDTVVLRVYLSRMQYTKVSTVKSYSEMALLSDLGGALGVLLGSTFLTVVEIFELISVIFFYAVAKKKKMMKT